MTKETLEAAIALAVICGLMLLVAAVTRYRPPRQINWLYGYRTARSMRTPATWQEANAYFARYFWHLSWLLPLVAVALLLLIGGPSAVLGLAGVVMAGLLIGMLRTERHLRRLFDDNGQPRA